MDYQAFAQLLGNYGEFLGAIAVVITLGYLAMQIHQNTRATRASSHHAVTDSLNQINLAIATDSELSQIWISGIQDRGSLLETQRQQFDNLMLAIFHVYDSLFYSANLGTGERNLLLAEERGFPHLMAQPGIWEWWEENPFAFSAEFRRYMEEFHSE